MTHPNQVWSTDITYIPMDKGFMYLVAILDWYSRYVVAWELSNSLDTLFCVEPLHTALSTQQPEIFNSDQGVQFTARRFTQVLEAQGIRIRMDGRGRAFDNIFIERLWRSLKYEHVYLHQHETVSALRQGLQKYFKFYHYERLHQALDYCTPAQSYARDDNIG